MPITRKTLNLPNGIIILAAVLGLAALLVYFDFNTVWRADNIIYDQYLKMWSRPAPDDVVIIEIDQASLNELGSLPWSRGVHARLIDKLSEVGAGPIGFDIVFAEPFTDDAAGDAELIRAVAANGRVVFPVYFEPLRPNGQLLELLPFPELADVAAGFGHIDLEFDRDGIIRSVFLNAGLGTAYWSSFAESLLRMDDTQSPARTSNAVEMAASDDARSGGRSMSSWQRDRRWLIPYAGPPEHFERTSYIDVLYEYGSAQELADKIILIGYTASGLDSFPTPVSGENQLMPGVEVHANILYGLRQGLNIREIGKIVRIPLTLGLIILPVLLFLRLPPRWAFLITLGGLALPIVGSFLLLSLLHLWFPPVVVVLSVLLGYLLWSWQRLTQAMRYLNQELKRLNAEPTMQSRLDIPQFETSMEFLHRVLPIQGCVLYNAAGEIEQQWGLPPLLTVDSPGVGQWVRSHGDHWTAFASPRGLWMLGVSWSETEQPDEKQLMLIDRLVAPYLRGRPERPRTPVEWIEQRITQVQRAGEQLRALRAFIQNSLNQMTVGVIVSDETGRVMLANPRAALHLFENANRVLGGESLVELLKQLQFSDTFSWQQSLKAVLLNGENVQLNVRNELGRDLQMEMAPFSDDRYLFGIIVQFTDISDLKESERKRREMIEFLSHDLRSPISSLMAQAQLAEHRPEHIDSGALTQQIRLRTESLLELVDEFLQLARAESGEAIKLLELDILLPAENAVMQVEPQAATRNTTLRTNFKVDQAWLLGNDNLLERTFINLLTNAVKYSPNGSCVELGIELQGGTIHCWVSDNGYGIDAEYLPTLFSRFRRIYRKEHQQEGGTGLGLPFVKTAVDRHYGRIEVDSTVNQGSCFHLYFPALEEQSTGLPAEV